MSKPIIVHKELIGVWEFMIISHGCNLRYTAFTEKYVTINKNRKEFSNFEAFKQHCLRAAIKEK